MKHSSIFLGFVFSLTGLLYSSCSEKKNNNLDSGESTTNQPLLSKIDSLESALVYCRSGNWLIKRYQNNIRLFNEQMKDSISSYDLNKLRATFISIFNRLDENKIEQYSSDYIDELMFWSTDNLDIERFIDDNNHVFLEQNVFCDTDSNFQLIETKVKRKGETDWKVPFLVFETDKKYSFLPLSKSVSSINKMYQLRKDKYLLLQKDKKGDSESYAASILEFKSENSSITDVQFQLNDSTYSLAYEQLGNEFKTSYSYNTVKKQLKVRFHESTETNCYKCNRVFNECYLKFDGNDFKVVEALQDTVVLIMSF